MLGHREAVAGPEHRDRGAGDAFDVGVDRLVERGVEERIDIADVDRGDAVAEGARGFRVQLRVGLSRVAEEDPAQVCG